MALTCAGDDQRPSCSRCQKAGLLCKRDYNVRFKHADNPSIKTNGPSKTVSDFRKSQTWVKTASSLVFLDGTEQVKSSYEHEKGYDTRSVRSSTPSSPPTSHPRMDPPRSSGDARGSPSHSRPSTSDTQSYSYSYSNDSDLWSPTGAPQSPFDSWQQPGYNEQATSPTGHLTSSPPALIPPTSTLSDHFRFGSSLDVIDANNPDTGSMDHDTKRRSLSGIYLERSVWPLSSREEAELLRYFVERLARDFDLTDPERHFREVVPRRAATCPVLLNAIYALSARHLSRVANYDPLVSDKYHSECLKPLIPALNDSAAILDENLLASTIILRHLEEFEVPLSGYSPSDRQHHLLGSHAFMKAQKDVGTSTGLKHAAFWVGLRQEIHVAFVNQRAPAIDPDEANVDRSFEAASDGSWSCRMVALCADVMRFCFGEDDKLSSVYDRLATGVEQWHNCKNDSFTPVYYKAADQEGSFPEIWILSDDILIGWQHYYIAKLLLVAHNPRVPRLGPARAATVLAMDEELKDYVRILCGIAISNPDTAPNFTYAAMSIVAAGDKFTQHHEQEALLNVLNICDSQYGFPTAHARWNLKASWGWTKDVD